jgi:hypothetical protein
MGQDLTTETISHFIGFFNQAVEETRMRQDYEAFKAKARLDDDLTEPLNITVNVSSKYAINDFAPGVSARMSNYSDVKVSLGPPSDPLPINLAGTGRFVANDLEDPFALLPMQPPAFAGLNLKLVLPPPSSVALAIIQKTSLQDSDILFTASPNGGFVPIHHYNQTLSLMTDASKTLSADWNATLPETGDDITPMGVSLYETAQDFTPETMEGAEIHVMTGNDVSGIYVDGKSVESVPDLDAAMPDYRTRETSDDEDIPHEVIAGGNMAVNALSLSTNWIDAPVMAITGNSYSLNAITQVNVLSNLDFENGSPIGHQPSDTVHNIAAFLHYAGPNAMPTEASDGDDDAEPEFPASAIVTRLTDDLVNFNWLGQYNYIVDHDILSVKFQGNETFLQTGGNNATNHTLLQELGFHYDLIMVGGDMINISIIDQVNVLLDNDSVSYGDGWQASGDGNLLWNEAMIETVGHDAYAQMSADYEALGESLASGSDGVGGSILSNAAFEGLDMLKVLYIDGDLINLQYISQTNIVGDADQMQVHAAKMATQDGAETSLIVGQNALLNLASIYEAGLNSEIQLGGDQYSDALMHQAGLIVTDESQLATENGNGLVNEAVAFLTDDSSEPKQDQDQSTPHSSCDDMCTDPMGGVLA